MKQQTTSPVLPIAQSGTASEVSPTTTFTESSWPKTLPSIESLSLQSINKRNATFASLTYEELKLLFDNFVRATEQIYKSGVYDRGFKLTTTIDKMISDLVEKEMSLIGIKVDFAAKAAECETLEACLKSANDEHESLQAELSATSSLLEEQEDMMESERELAALELSTITLDYAKTLSSLENSKSRVRNLEKRNRYQAKKLRNLTLENEKLVALYEESEKKFVDKQMECEALANQVMENLDNDESFGETPEEHDAKEKRKRELATVFMSTDLSHSDFMDDNTASASTHDSDLLSLDHDLISHDVTQSFIAAEDNESQFQSWGPVRTPEQW